MSVPGPQKGVRRSAGHLDDLDAFASPLFFLQIDHLRFAAAALATALTFLVAAKQVGGAVSSDDCRMKRPARDGDGEEPVKEGEVVQCLRVVGRVERMGGEGTCLAVSRVADRINLMRRGQQQEVRCTRRDGFDAVLVVSRR